MASSSLNINPGSNNALSPAKAGAIGRRMSGAISGNGAVSKPLMPHFGATLTGFGKAGGSTPKMVKLPVPGQAPGKVGGMNPFAQF